MWICKYCTNSNKENYNFNEKEFVNHLRCNHLYKYNHNQHVQFRCSYGDNGKCFLTIDNEIILSEFTSEKEYGRHILKIHLKQAKKPESNQFIVSENVPLENCKNYNDVVHPDANSSAKWNPYHSVVNLPAALNDPSHRQLDVFSKTWGESFEKSELPPAPHLVAPDKGLFASYIEKVRCSLKYRETMLKRINDNKNSEVTLVDNNQKLQLENVPKLFFQSDFNLNSKDIFSSVIPIFHSTSSPSPSDFTLLDNNILYRLSNTSGRPKNQKWLTDTAANRMNDKLSYYLDIVEINIAKQVSKKSNSFFEAVSTHDKVQEKLKNALSQISVVRSKLHQADDKLTKNHLHVLNLDQRKTNLQILLKELRIVKTVHSTQAIIQTLLASNDFCGALDVIAGTQNIMQYELFSSKDNQISPIMCLRHVHAQLVEMRMFVEKMVQQEFVNAISNQLRIENDSQMTNGDVEIDYQLVPSLLAMIRIVVYAPSPKSNLNEFVQLYFDEAMEILMTIVKSRVLQAYSKSCHSFESSTTNPQMENGAPATLADQMRSLNYDQWMDMLNNISSDMLILLDKVRIGAYTMVDTILTHVNKSGIVCDSQHVILPVQTQQTVTEQLRTSTISEIETLPSKIVEAIQQRVTKLIRARSKDRYLERLLSAQMVQLNTFLRDLASQIVLRVGQAPDRSNDLISSCLYAYANRLATRFHNEHREKLLLILDSDLWRAAEVPSQLQELARHISNQPGISLLDKNCVIRVPESSASNQWLQIDLNRFTVVGAALMLFQMIVEYCQCAIDMCQIPSIPELVFSNLVSLLEVFNSRSCQLVLGAKARQLVELETISARNLALAARSLQLVLALTPRIIVQFSGFGEPLRPALLGQLTEVEKMYRDHIEKINAKLISLMEDRIKSRLAVWTGRPPTPSGETRAICQHLSKLHEAICDVYETTGETELFLRIHNVFKAHLRIRMKDIDIAMDNGPQHGIVKLELAFYMGQLTGFCGLKKFSDNFSDIWS